MIIVWKLILCKKISTSNGNIDFDNDGSRFSSPAIGHTILFLVEKSINSDAYGKNESSAKQNI